jgi:mRNA interferase RelE/StbE
VKYRILYTQRAVKDISKLDPEVKGRIKKAMEKYSEIPLSYSKKLADTSLGTYRFRVGDYRIIFDIENNDLVVLRIGHRREIYRR